MQQKKKILLTGASGFIALNLASYLRKKGYYLIGLSRREQENPAGQENYDEYLCVDILNETEDLSRMLLDVDYVVHLAGNAHESRELAYMEYYRANVLLTEKLAKLAAKSAVKKFIFISTIKVNGEFSEAGRPFSAEDPANPQDNYSKSKYEAEKSIQQLCNEEDMKYVIIRPPLVFGPGVKANFLSMLKIVKKGWPMPFAGIQNCRSFIYVDNLADIIERCFDSANVNNKLYLVKDYSMSLPELLRGLSAAAGRRIVLFPIPIFLLQGLAATVGKSAAIKKLSLSLEIDDSKLRKDLGWKPSVTLQDAMQTVVSCCAGRGK